MLPLRLVPPRFSRARDRVSTWDYRVVRAKGRHVPALPAIERAAAQLFPHDDLPVELRGDVFEHQVLAEAARDERLWVALTAADEPIGFALVTRVDGLPHLREIDVHPAHARRGVGRGLVEAVLEDAARNGHPAVTLTTFRHLSWNAPFYARCGFRELQSCELLPELRRVLEEEARSGLDPRKRVAMLCEIGSKKP